jgi:hypothetical protein
VRGKGTKLGEGCPKVRLSQDRMAIFSQIRNFYIRDCFVREKFMAPIISFLLTNSSKQRDHQVLSSGAVQV